MTGQNNRRQPWITKEPLAPKRQHSARRETSGGPQLGITPLRQPVLRKILCLSCASAALLLSSCRTSLDTVTFVRKSSNKWEPVLLREGEIDELGIYKFVRSPRAKAGLMAMIEPSLPEASWQGVLGPGDRVPSSVYCEDPPNLYMQSNVVLEVAQAPSATEARPAIYKGKCEVVAYQPTQLIAHRSLEIVKRYPISYKSKNDGTVYAAEDLGPSNVVEALVVAPMYLMILLVGGVPFSGLEPVEFREETIRSYVDESSESTRHSYFRPVSQQRVMWSLECSGTEGPIELWGAVTTDASGRAQIPLDAHEADLRASRELHPDAIFSVGLPGAPTVVSMSIDLRELRLGR